VAHQFGTQTTKYPRSSVAKLPVVAEIEVVMRNTNRLNNSGHGITKIDSSFC